MPKTFTIIKGIVLFAVVACVTYFVLVVFAGIPTRPAPPVPTITYGEFPFRVEYKLNGELHVIEDTIIAVFNRSIRGNATTRARRIWDTSLASGDDNDISNAQFLLLQDGELTIRFRPALGDYFMGDAGGGDDIGISNARLLGGTGFVIRYRNESDRISVNHYNIGEAAEPLREHGIELISWDIAKPITNSIEIRFIHKLFGMK